MWIRNVYHNIIQYWYSLLGTSRKTTGNEEDELEGPQTNRHAIQTVLIFNFQKGNRKLSASIFTIPAHLNKNEYQISFSYI